MGTMVKDFSYWINFTYYPHFSFQNWEFLHSLSLKQPDEKETHKEGDRSGSFTPGPFLPTLGAVLHRVVKSCLGTLEFGARWGVMELEGNVSQAQSPLGPACSTRALTHQSGGLVLPAPSFTEPDTTVHSPCREGTKASTFPSHEFINVSPVFLP